MGWSAEHCHWYYFNSAIGVTQWALPVAATQKKPSLVAACYDHDAENEEQQTPCDNAASLALAMALQEQEDAYQQASRSVSASSRAATMKAEAKELRRHLFEGTPTTSEAPATARPLCASNGLSYAKAARVPGEVRLGLAHPAAPAPAAPPAAQRALLCSSPGVSARRLLHLPRCPREVRPPQEVRLLLDGANVAFRFGKANGRGGCFCAHGLRLCVEYFVARGVDLRAISAAVKCAALAPPLLRVSAVRVAPPYGCRSIVTQPCVSPLLPFGCHVCPICAYLGHPFHSWFTPGVPPLLRPQSSRLPRSSPIVTQRDRP